jgi:glucokinase
VSASVFGVDLGGTQVRVALAGSDGTIRSRTQAAVNPNAEPAEGVAEIARMMRELSVADGIAISDVTAVGLGTPGPSDHRAGVLLTPPNLPAWHGYPLADRLARATGLTVLMENDANLAALGELRRGAGRGARHLLFVIVGTGIGGGIVIDGRIYSGAGGTAGELGHAVVDLDGPTCRCGARGCLETLASGSAIARIAAERIAAGEDSALAGHSGTLSAREVGLAAAEGDGLARAVLREAGHHLGIALGGVINILDPEVVVLGGGVMQAGPPLLDAMREAIRRQAFATTLEHVRIVQAELGQDAGLVGAVEWAVEHAC